MRRNLTLPICIVTLLVLLLCLMPSAAPAYGSEFLEFTGELAVSPVSASNLEDLDDGLIELRKSAQELRIEQKTEAAVEARITELSALAETLQSQGPASGDASYMQTVENLIAYYRNYRSSLKDLAASNSGSISSAASSPAIGHHDTLRLALHKTFTDIRGDYFVARNYVRDATSLLQELKKVPPQNHVKNSPEALAVELKEMNFLNHLLDYQSSILDLKNELALLDAQKSDLAALRGNVQFQQEELDNILALLNEQLDERLEQKKFLDAREEEAERNYFREKETFDTIDSQEIVPRAANSVPHSRLARSYVLYVCSWAWSQLHDDSISGLRAEKEFWQDRFDFHNGNLTGDRLRETREKLHRAIRTAVDLSDVEAYRIQSNYTLALQGLRNNRARTEGEIRNNLDVAVNTIEEVLTESSRNYSMERQRHLLWLYTFQEELEDNQSTSQYFRQVGAVWKKITDLVWNAVLWEGDNYTVTVRKLTWALIIVFAGFRSSLWLSRFLARRMSAFSAKSETLHILLVHIFFYSFLCIFILFALRVVHIPLTAFAFIGGGVAVGFGLGLQTVCANLFGGIFIMTTQPFRLRDIVQIGEHTGVVTEINSRSTVVQCYDETEVVVPNRYFMENSFTNWTRKSPLHRYRMPFITSLDADPDEVRSYILNLIALEPRIAGFPAPWACLKEFDYTGLTFEVYYWLDAARYPNLQVAGGLLQGITAFLKEKDWMSRWEPLPLVPLSQKTNPTKK